MKITSLEIERFGLWAGLMLPQLSDGINVFYGANETGKSTLMEFIRAALYGFGNDRQRFVQMPRRTERLSETSIEPQSLVGESFVISGGLLQIESRSGDRYQLRRMFLPERTGNEDQVDIQTPDGTKQGTQLLRSLVSGVDEQTFNNVFSIGLDELQQLASLNDTEAAEMLFRLSVGMDRVAIVDTIKELSARRNKILNIAETEGKPSLLTQLLREREKITSELSETKNLIRQYVQLRNEQRVVDRSVAQLEEDHAKLQRERRLYEIAKTAEPIWMRRDQLREEISAMGTVIVVSDAVIQQLNEVGSELTERRFAYEKVKEEYQKAKKAITSLPVNEKIVKNVPRIEFLLEEESRIVELDAEIHTLEREIEDYNRQITAEESQVRRGTYPLPRSENAPQGGAANGHTVQASVLEEYRSYAKAVNHSRKRLSKAQQQHAELQRRSRDLNDRLKVETAKRETGNLTEAADRAAEMVRQLRQRQSIGQKMNEMVRHHKELRRINAFLIQNQALPGWQLGLVFLTGIAGIAFIALGLFPPTEVSTSLSVASIVFGCFAAAGAYLGKLFAEKSNAKKLAHNQRQLAALTMQLDQAKQEAETIDARFPFAGTATMEARLQDAQQELAALEKLMPVETQRQEVQQRLKQIEVRLQHDKEENTAAMRRWDDWLRRVGLPGDWTPARIREHLEHCDIVGDLRKEFDKRCDIVNQRVKDIKVLTSRVDQLVSEINLSIRDGASYVQIFEEIRKALEENNLAVQKRERLIKGMKDFRKMRRKVVADLHKAKQQETDLLRQFGVKTPEELRALHQRHQKHRRLLVQEQGVQRELEAAMSNFCSEATLGTLLEPRIARKGLLQKIEAEREQQLQDGDLEYQDEALSEELARLEPLPELDDLLKGAVRRIEASSAKLHEELQNRGQLNEQLKRIAEDQTATQKQRELAVIDEKIREAQSEWQVYAVCARMLDEIRSTYERDRQPRTLAEASEILKRLTDEKYHRIWTPLGEETLMVDDHDGNTFDISWISRGAREQLFIALRLALASEFARHGSVLPLILDDVLVNFDSRRAWAAMQVLQDVAATGSGRQIFVFTCHEHVCRMFQKMDIPVRILPSVEEPGKPMRVLQPRSVLERRKRRRLRQQQRLESEKAKRRIENELASREESIRLDAIRRAEVQRMTVLMQQQATAEKAFEEEHKGQQM